MINLALLAGLVVVMVVVVLGLSRR